MEGQKTIKEIEAEIVEEFSFLESWEDKYEYIIELGRKVAPLDEASKKDENRVKGCQSTVGLVSEFRNGRVFFQAERNSTIVQGLISMLIRVLSGQKPDDIVEAKLDFLNEIGMMTHLAQTRSNGLLAMVKQMKNYALAFKLKHESV
jgi:cysteine desulfuration protein SufE